MSGYHLTYLIFRCFKKNVPNYLYVRGGAINTQPLLDFQNDLLNLLLSGGGIKELVTKIASTLNKKVIITNPYFYVLASSDSQDGNTEEYAVKLLRTDDSSRRATIFLDSREIEVLAIELSSSLIKWGFLFILEPGFDENKEMFNYALQARTPCCLELQKREEMLANKQQYKDIFLFDLLYGNIEDRSDLVVMGEIWGWDFRLPHVVAVLEIDNYELYSNDLELIQRTMEIVDSVLKSQGTKAILTQRNEEVVLIMRMEEGRLRGNKAYLSMIINQIRAQTEVILNKHKRRVNIGVGRTYVDPTELFRSYQEAKVALKLNYLLANDQGVFAFFTDLGLERILYSHDQQELKEFYREVLEDLERFDKERNNDLMDTLEQFLAHRCDNRATANALFLHPNTLRYRLKKVEEILQLDLNDFNIILSLVVAFKIKRLTLQ